MSKPRPGIIRPTPGTAANLPAVPGRLVLFLDGKEQSAFPTGDVRASALKLEAMTPALRFTVEQLPSPYAEVPHAKP